MANPYVNTVYCPYCGAPESAWRMKPSKDREIYEGRNRRVSYCASTAIAMVGVSSKTFYKAVKALGIKPRRRYKRKFRYYTYDDIMRIWAWVASPSEILREAIRKSDGGE